MEVRRCVREVVLRGADFIKLFFISMRPGWGEFAHWKRGLAQVPRYAVGRLWQPRRKHIALCSNPLLVSRRRSD